MSKVEIYTTNDCPYCGKAKKLLIDREIEYSEYRLEGNREKMREMLKRCREKSVPQIFINGNHIGGYEELVDLDKQDKLAALLSSHTNG